jgi:thiamine pyrophosphokinase
VVAFNGDDMPHKVVIIANGGLSDSDAAREIVSSGNYIIAADGGANYLFDWNILPDLLVGDLDSVRNEIVEVYAKIGIEIRRCSPDKDETDLELAIQAALDRGCEEIIVVAALGGRLDQTLGNLFLLTKGISKHCKIRLDDGVEEGFLIRRSSAIKGRVGDTVSLIPLSARVMGITTHDLRFPLADDVLYRHKTRGISNLMSADTAQVTLRSGLLLCIHSRRRD